MVTDLPIFFGFMQDKDSLWQAAFTSKDPSDREAHDQHWHKMLGDDQIVNHTVLVDGNVAGNIGRYLMDDELQITYWIGSEFQGAGVASNAVKLFLEAYPERPVSARTAFDNHASAKVLINNGFLKSGSDRFHANARGSEIEETIWILA